MNILATYYVVLTSNGGYVGIGMTEEEAHTIAVLKKDLVYKVTAATWMEAAHIAQQKFLEERGGD